MIDYIFHHRLALLCVVALLVPACIQGQVDGDSHPVSLLIGPRIGLNTNYYGGGLDVYCARNCPVYESGTGRGFLGGLTAEFVSNSGAWSIIPAITFDSRPGTFTRKLPEVMVVLDTIPVNQKLISTTDITYQLVGAEVMYKRQIWQPCRVFSIAAAAGPAVGYVVRGKKTQYLDLVEPVNSRFPIEMVPQGGRLANDGRRIIVADGQDIPSRKDFRFSVKGGVQAEIALFDHQLVISPGAFFDFGLTNVTDQENWGLNSIQLQVDVRQAF